jgi:hypothetical protein
MQFILDEGEAGLGEGDQLDLRIHLSATSWVLAEGEVLRLDEVAEPVPVEKAWLATSGKPAGKPAPIGRAGVAGKPGPAARAGSVGRPVSAAKVVPPAGAAAADEPLPATKMITLIAVRFVSIPEAAQDRIVRHIFALQRMRRDRARRLG